MAPDKQFIEFLVKLGATKIDILSDGTISVTFPEQKPFETFTSSKYPEKITYVPYGPDATTVKPSYMDWDPPVYITTGRIGYYQVKDSEIKDITNK